MYFDPTDGYIVVKRSLSDVPVVTVCCSFNELEHIHRGLHPLPTEVEEAWRGDEVVARGS